MYYVHSNADVNHSSRGFQRHWFSSQGIDVHDRFPVSAVLVLFQAPVYNEVHGIHNVTTKNWMAMFLLTRVKCRCLDQRKCWSESRRSLQRKPELYLFANVCMTVVKKMSWGFQPVFVSITSAGSFCPQTVVCAKSYCFEHLVNCF